MDNTNVNVQPEENVLFEDDVMRAVSTGHTYDFIAYVENNTDNDLTIRFRDDSLENLKVPARDWVGIEANDAGWEMASALEIRRFDYEQDVREVFYAVQETREDGWDHGSTDFLTALEMAEALSNKAIVVEIDVENSTCIDEIERDDDDIWHDSKGNSYDTKAMRQERDETERFEEKEAPKKSKSRGM